MGANQNQDHYCLRSCKALITDKGTALQATLAAQKSTFQKWKEELQEHQKAGLSKTFLLWPQHHHYEQGGICSTTGQLKMHYDYYPRLLQNEMKLRKKDNKRFEENQMWYLLYALAQAKNTLAEKDQLVGDIHPRNIFLNAQSEVKVACLMSWPGQVSSYRKVKTEQDWAYLAPEDIQRLKLGAMDNKINTESEIFAIGLVILAVSTNNMHHDLYPARQQMFDLATFNSRLNRFQHDFYYSQIFRAVVSNLLQIDPAKRLNSAQLKWFLSKHETGILSRKSLLIDNVPKKLQQSVDQMLKTIAVAKVQKMPPPPPAQPLVKNVNQAQKQAGNRIISQTVLPTIINTNSQQIASMIQQKLAILNSQVHSSQIQNITSRQGAPKAVFLYQNVNQSNARYQPASQIEIQNQSVSQGDPVRPSINKNFSTASIRSPRASQAQAAGKNKPFENIQKITEKQKQVENKNFKEPILIQQSKVEQVSIEVQNHSTPTEVWQNKQITMVRELNNLMIQTGQSGQNKKQDSLKGQNSNGPTIILNDKFIIEQVKSDQQSQKLQNSQELNVKQTKQKPTQVENQKTQKRVQKINENGKDKIQNQKNAQKHKDQQKADIEDNQKSSKNHFQTQKSKQNQEKLNDNNPVKLLDFKENETVKQKLSEKQGQVQQITFNQDLAQTKKLVYQTVAKQQEKRDDFQGPLNLKAAKSKIKQQNNNKQILQSHNQIKKDKIQQNQVQILQKITKKIQNQNADKQQQIKKVQQNENMIALDSQPVVADDQKLASTVKITGKQNQNTKVVNLTQNSTAKVQIKQNEKQFKGEILDKIQRVTSQNSDFKPEKKVNNYILIQENSKITQSASDISLIDQYKKSLQKAQESIVKQKTQQLAVKLKQKAQESIVDSKQKESKLVDSKVKLQKQKQKNQDDSRNAQTLENQISLKKVPDDLAHKNDENIGKKDEVIAKNNDVLHVNSYHTYLDVPTNSSYDACWQLLLNVIQNPSLFFSEINRDKVSSTKGQDQWKVKVGPAVMRVETNKQEGKIFLSALPGSKCTGQILGGVFKDQQKMHRLWVNSGLYYKNNPFPAKNFWQNGLKAAIASLQILQK